MSLPKQRETALYQPRWLFLLKQLIEKAVADNAMFMHNFREVQTRVLSSGERE